MKNNNATNNIDGICLNKVKVRCQIIKSIRQYFEENDFIEVETPLLVNFPDPSPYHRLIGLTTGGGEKVYLTPSPEIYLKKYLAAGLTNIFEITKAFRDYPEADQLHKREFTVLEWYRSKANYQALMTDVEDLYHHIEKRLCKTRILTPPWPKISCEDAFRTFANIDLRKFLDIDQARVVFLEKGYKLEADTTWEQMYHQIFLNEVEPELMKLPAVFLYDYPLVLGEYAKVKDIDPVWAERFEFYLGGMEIGNGYSELLDANEQKQRYIRAVADRKRAGMPPVTYDKSLVQALRSPIPPTAGIGVGIDRTVMYFTDTDNINLVAPFNK